MSKLARTRDGAVRMAELPRVVPFLFRDAANPGDGNTLAGYASVFNAETIIDSWEGRFKEQFLSGSMKKTFRDLTPIIQFDHGRHPLIGSLPVAHFDAGYPREETDPERAPDGGAHVVAQLHQSPLFEPVREVISTGTVSGMSIRFAPTKERWYWPDGRQEKNPSVVESELYRTWREDVPDEELMRRDIVEASVAEMGPVVWPAYTTTSVGVRSLFGERATVDPDEDPSALLLAVDGVLDQISELVADVDTATLPVEVQQALTLITAAEVTIDELLDLFGITDPDDARSAVPKDPTAAPGASSAGGGGDAERQAAEASASKKERAKRVRGLNFQGL
jgi:phage head maturation protease